MNKLRVLIVDDEPQIRRVLRPSLIASGYEVREAANGDEALSQVSESMPDLVILDLGLPDMDGKEALRKLRLMTTKTPVIILSARERESEKIAALDLGANDYVEKPFAMGELLARMRAALRLARGVDAEPAIVTAGALWVDIPKRLVAKNGQTLRLTPKEFDLLTILARNAGRPLTHREILRAVWGASHQDDVQYLRVFVGQLRAKIEDDPATPRIVLTETGIGYRFIAD
ncbi:response regulator transcription factor (plasmid) [Methylocystis sp. MJC1]|jgi:two-component system KDP operon response regulator KdpE|uniref:response regulator n=1 Tax=Methylocystis sp. MJC1 TaxID=2654282 RepID=UPI0013EB19EC|nr:response regulator transcription factor [Methylocystis sp. MJC1]KAF2989092.1 KDP operon transcriptional regulatory protein KdpE [Methylocystis sp. MJC1]MBU6529129.1 response regulator transcription factor [Methylocystis sp. MJC1]UZX14064.1 response regulator transcription factor [Methylocystis sp. MJC1]